MFSIERRNTRSWHRLNAVLRLAVLRGATAPIATNYIVNEYPKSGGTWVSQMLADALDLPFPRNRLPMWGSCLMQCHVLNPVGMRRVTLVWRDGRDIAVSFYHHLLRGHDFASPEMAADNARKIGIRDPEDVQANLPRFIEALYERRIGPSFTWAEFVNAWADRPDAQHLRYEILLKDAAGELSRVVEALTGRPLSPARAAEIADRYSFRRLTGRNRGEETGGQFLRKGIAGDWQNVFSDEAIKVFDHYAGPQLRRLGYVGQGS